MFPFQNVLTQRILPSEEATSYFVECGMPAGSGFGDLSGQWGGSGAGTGFNDPDLDDYRIWLQERGRRCYMSCLISSPRTMLLQPLAQIPEMLEFQGETYFAEGFVPILPGVLEALLNPSTTSRGLYWLTLLVCVVAVVTSSRRESTHWSLPIMMILLTYPHAVMVWHGDAMEVGRHSLAIGVQFSLGLWMLLFFAIDFIASRGLRQKPSPLAPG